jgi:hypothetical protein
VTNRPLKVEVKITRQYDTNYLKQDFSFGNEKNGYDVQGDSVKLHVFDIDIIIENSSDKSIYLWLMSCSWTDNILVNNDYMFLYRPECDKNFPKQIKIEPGKSRIYHAQLTKSIKFDNPCEGCVYGKQVEATKLGLIVINDVYKSEFVDYVVLMNDKSTWATYWSNPLFLLMPKELDPDPITIPVYKHN